MAPGRQDRDRYWTLFGDWVRARLAEQKPDKWTQVRLRDELADIGIAVKREWVNQVINGKPPSDDLRKGIERLLGPFPEPDAAGDPNASAYLARIDALVRTVELQNAMLVQVLSGPSPATMKRLKAWSTSVLARVESSPSLPQTPDADGSPA